MPDYRAMYYRLAGKVADAIDLLIEVQRENEEMAMKEDIVINVADFDDEAEG